MARGFNYAPGASEEVAQAQEPGLHRTQVTVLASSKNTLVREAIAGRADLPLGLMVTLAHDKATEVRAAIAANATAAQTILEHLVADRHIPVLEALLGNPALSPALVEKLAFHRKSEVRAAAAARLNEPVSTPASVPLSTLGAPEIQEHVAVVGDSVVLDFPSGEPVQQAPEGSPDEEAARPTRTAPVRGFRISR
ncbi:hypothetical protein [Demequina sp. NBRC 110051]|uniref:hypothetical protein n=1 Tax=Demequina sp. NBRC 110051 TaxID=1570340 RepID=UPI000A01EE75|nr:hypothetical protein [Demequina sp. NBRC 110051]